MIETTYQALNLPSYKAWSKQQGYHSDSFFDAVYALLFWPMYFFLPNPENERKREYRTHIKSLMREG